MLTKATIKLIKSLQQKKYRNTHELFVVEGKKSVEEFLAGDFILKFFFVTEAFAQAFPQAEICSEKQMQQMSGLRNAPNVLAVFEQKSFSIPQMIDKTYFALDDVQDPGNLGTIIRLADWFGMHHIFCSENTVDVYNPKVVQACMGSLARVKIHYVNLAEYLKSIDCEIFGTFMNGHNLYQNSFPNTGIVVMGNEAHGISPEIEKLCTQKIAIPQAGNSTESLNVAMASAIVASEIFRQKNH